MSTRPVEPAKLERKGTPAVALSPAGWAEMVADGTDTWLETKGLVRAA